MATVTILQKARKLIEQPSKWTRGAYARDKDSCPVDFSAVDAYSFCATGAVYRASSAHYEEADYVLSLLSFIAKCGIITYNDLHSHDTVLAVFDDAIGYASTARDLSYPSEQE